MKRVASILFAALTLAGCGKRDDAAFEMMPPPPGEAASPELPKHWSIPDFTLTERSGQPGTLADLRGKVWVADFFYTSCPGPCPMLSSRLSALQETFSASPDVRLVSISTDPAKDTPAVLQQYATRFKAGPNWLFFTGDKTSIFELANKGFKLSVTEERNNPEPITHSTKLVLVDRTGTVRGFYEGTTTIDSARLIADIKRLLAEKP